MTSIQECLGRLQAGNQRFVTGGRELQDLTDAGRRASVSAGQRPFAVVLGCSDSRVPPEVIFDEGLGDLFVIRVAGNIAADSQIASVEFAIETFGIPLVVVLGHSRCGAVVASLETLRKPVPNGSPDLHAIIDRIRPAVEPLLSRAGSNDSESLVAEAVVSNISLSVDQLRQGSKYLERRVSEGDLAIVGACYSLDTGEVEFFSSS